MVALRGAGLALAAGEVHAVLGANGAGKTTLLRVLGGLHPPDRGDVRVDGRSVRLASPRDAWRYGIGLVHQHFTLVPRLTVRENLALGVRFATARFGGGGTLPLDRVTAAAEALGATTGLHVPMDAPVETLSVSVRQRVEVLKVLLRGPRVLALDEPTAVLAPAEVEGLLALLRVLAREGRAVVLVAHKLDEVLGVADRVTVLREGRTVLEAPRADVDAAALARAMLGEEADAPGAAPAATPTGRRAPGAVVARLERAAVPGPRGALALVEATLEVRRGEIVGVAGVEGNGQRELALLLAGRAVAATGSVSVPADPGFIPQDRTTEGLVPAFDLTENLALALHRRAEWRRGPLLRWAALRARTEALLARYQVRAAGARARAGTLSGGNQQRWLVAREVESGRDLLVAENPTRGLDVAATAFVHAQLRRLRDEGDTGVVVVSTDLDEVLALADRVCVMVRGRLIEMPSDRRTRAEVGARMLSADGTSR